MLMRGIMKLNQEAISFYLDSSQGLNASIDRLISLCGESVELLGLGEALHGGEEMLTLRNRLFQRLVQRHGYSAIAIESSFPRGWSIVMWPGGAGFPMRRWQRAGFSHGFGRLEANRELVEWMRQDNADPSHPIKLQFYGFDSPTEMCYADSPGYVLYFVLDYISSLDGRQWEGVSPEDRAAHWQ